ncbi:hypothetical protein C0J52_10530 [Blattella germanica]|nr:hypothetical protein C0J52_10530 [Blattella germanica]
MKFTNITYKALCYTKQAHQLIKQKTLNRTYMRNIQMPKPELDIQYLCDPKHKSEIEQNIRNRKGVGNISRVAELYNALTNGSFTEKEKSNLQNEFESEARQIPNKSSPLVSKYGETPKIVSTVGSKTIFNFKPKAFNDITNALHLARTENLSNLAGHKSYYFMGELVELEQALIQFTVKRLLAKGFQLVSVPDILPAQIIEGCGMKTRGDRTQVYKLDPHLYEGDLCLSGTSEMALAAFVMNHEFKENELPLKLAAVSSCSDCTDYQSRRLNIKYRSSDSDVPIHAHTVNGTACAIPRTLIALLETHQQADGSVEIPRPLQGYMKGKTSIQHQHNIPTFKFMRSKIRTPKD